MGTVTIYNETVTKFFNAELDPINHTLCCGGETVYLRNKLWQVVQMLADNPGQLVSRHQLIDDIWHGNYYTGQAGLTHTICHVRKLIDDLGIDAVIDTIPKTGYVLNSKKKTDMSFTQRAIENTARPLQFPK